MLREKRTIAVMIAMYCRGRHGSGGPLCVECEELRQYAFARLDRCRFGSDKPPCASCTVHCYKPAMREKARAVMRYAGPRMIWRHPILALRHWLDGRRNRSGPGQGAQP
jgi:hypothetical protein